MKGLLFVESFASTKSGFHKLLVELSPSEIAEHNYFTFFAKWSRYFTCCILFTVGPSASLTLYAPFGAKEKFPADRELELKKECETLRRNGVFGGDFPNSGISLITSPLKIQWKGQLGEEEFEPFTDESKFNIERAAGYIVPSSVEQKVFYRVYGEVVN